MESKLPGNSYQNKTANNHTTMEDPKPKINKKVVSGQVKKKKNKFMSSVISEDAGKVKSYVLLDVLIPALKKTLYDIITSTIEIVLYGETKGGSRSNQSKISYASYYGGNVAKKYDDRPARSVYDYDGYIIPTRAEAEETLRSLEELIDAYGMASVADYYECIGVSGNFTDNKYGWKDLRAAKVIRGYDGYYIQFPRVEPLN